MSDNTVAEMVGWDTKGAVSLFSAEVSKHLEWFKSAKPGEVVAKLPEIRDSIRELYVYGIEVWKLGKELQETFDKFVKLSYELDIYSKDDLPLVYVPQREGAGRTKMSAEDRIKALQSRLDKED